MIRRPQKELTPADKTWLFTKTLVFLGLSMGSIPVSVGFAVWLGAMGFTTTGSRLIGICVGLAGYMSAMGGRDWLEFFLIRLLFSEVEAREIAMASKGDEGGPSDA